MIEIKDLNTVEGGPSWIFAE